MNGNNNNDSDCCTDNSGRSNTIKLLLAASLLTFGLCMCWVVPRWLNYRSAAMEARSWAEEMNNRKVDAPTNVPLNGPEQGVLPDAF